MELGNLFFGNSRGYFLIKDRYLWFEAFNDFFKKTNIDSYGYFNNDNDKRFEVFETDRGGYENDTYLINPYYWGDDKSIAEKPNFIFKPTNFTIDWYKYPLRDSYMNQDISFVVFEKILNHCYKSYVKSIANTEKDYNNFDK